MSLVKGLRWLMAMLIAVIIVVYCAIYCLINRKVEEDFQDYP